MSILRVRLFNIHCDVTSNNNCIYGVAAKALDGARQARITEIKAFGHTVDQNGPPPYQRTTRSFFTFVTPSVLRAIWPARTLVALLSTNPLNWTTFLNVVTSICIDFRAGSFSSAALTLVVMVESSMYSPAVSRPDVASQAATVNNSRSVERHGLSSPQGYSGPH